MSNPDVMSERMAEGRSERILEIFYEGISERIHEAVLERIHGTFSRGSLGETSEGISKAI